MEGLYFYNVPKSLQETIETLASIEPNDLEGNILGLVWSGIKIEDAREDFKRKGIRRRAFSEKEIERAIQNLRDQGFIDKEGLITEMGIEALNVLSRRE